MLNNEKIRLMTKLSLYESKNESKELKAGKYYRSDYISLGLLNSAIVATLAFFIVFALIIFVNIEELLQVITTLDFLEIGKVLVSTYLIYLVGYLCIVYVVYRVRYEKMSKGIKTYDAMLKELYMIYKKEGNSVHESPEQNYAAINDIGEEVDEVDDEDEDDIESGYIEEESTDKDADESYEIDLISEEDYLDESEQEDEYDISEDDYEDLDNDEDDILIKKYEEDLSDGEIEISVLEEE